MRVPTIVGMIERRVLVNYRVDPGIVRRILPHHFRPHLVGGMAIAGICWIRLRGIRPQGMPRILGLDSENVAHRIAIEWGEACDVQRGVYIPRRDTSSVLNAMAGGRLFPGVHHQAKFYVSDTGSQIRLECRPCEAAFRVRIGVHPTEAMARKSVFASLTQASDFFQRGGVGYSPRRSGDALDAIELSCNAWAMTPLHVDLIEASYFDDRSRFPSGSIEVDSAFVMRNIPHRWRSVAPIGDC